MTLISIISFCVILSIVRASDNVDTNNPLPYHCNYVNESLVRIYAASLVEHEYLLLVATIQKPGQNQSKKIMFQETYVDYNPTHFYQSDYIGENDITKSPSPTQWTFTAHTIDAKKGFKKEQYLTYWAYVRI